jgi:choline dehydrogenase-like flavoprotein
MIVDLEHNPNPPVFSADVCIVGAGAAGIVLAAELVRQGRRVLLLESGGADLESAAQALNECSHTGQSQQAGSIGRFRVLGGTTTAWGGQILEFNREDFSSRPWVSGSGWPFPKDELEPYYEKALRAEGLSDVTRSDSEVWRQMKMAAPNLGDGLEAYFTRWCPEPNFARLYRELLASPNLCVVLHATATAMLLDETGARLRGVQCKTPAGRAQIFSAERYILSLGTIETVRFLLQPLPGTQTPPWNRSGLLGRHFQSHVDFNAARVPSKNAHRLRMLFANAYLNGQKYHPKFRLAFPVQEKEEILNIAGSITCINEEEQELQRIKSLVRNVLQGRPSDFQIEDLTLALRQARTMVGLGYGYAVEHRAYWPQKSTFWLRVHCEQEPLSDSRITLTGTRDATGLLRAHLDWRVSPSEWKTIRCFTRQVERIFAARGWGQVSAQPELACDDGYCNVTFDNSHHDMGGTRMATSAAEGVVDAQLRLHGVDNIYVCSASVFPSSGFSNPTHTLIALALRLADHLTKENVDA